MNSRFEGLVEQVSRVILGKKTRIRMALVCLLARGHLLIEDIPGIGKTTLAKVLSRCLGLDFCRIQCTSDMLPGDILGVSVFEQKTGRFVFRAGPIFTQVLLADEINRATPKTQSALLEAMEEGQVTFEGETRPLKRPFFVIATQNPVEQSGTFPLPESQLDRFLMRIRIGYPDRAAEKELLRQGDVRHDAEGAADVWSMRDVTEIQRQVRRIHVSDALLDYVQDLLDFTRTRDHFRVGLSPRAGLSLLHATRSMAWCRGRDYAVPEDLQAVLPSVAGHRLHEREDGAEFTEERLMELLMRVPIP